MNEQPYNGVFIGFVVLAFERYEVEYTVTQ